MKLKSSYKLILALILLLGFLIRGVNINSNPPSLYGDELTIVYDSYSILKTGYDQRGDFLPITFSMGAGRPGGYVYGSIPFVALFGPTALGVRSLSLISGVISIFLIYLIGRRLLNKKVGIIAALLMTTNPWAVSISRGGFEANLALVLALLGLWFFLLAEKRTWLYILSAICFGLTIHTYPTYKVAIPLFLLLIFYLLRQQEQFYQLITRKFFLTALVVLIFFFSISIWQTVSFASEARFLNLNVFSQKELAEKIIQQVNSERNLSDLPAYVKPFFHNSIWNYQQVLINSYLNNFSWDYLFLRGDGNPRHNMGEMGGLFMVEIIFLIFGAKYLYLEKRKVFLFLLGWILLAPIPTTLLLESHNLRNLFMLPPLILLSASGVYYLSQIKFKFQKIFFIIIAILLLAQFVIFLERILFLSPNKLSRFWAYPAKTASYAAFKENIKYDHILVTDRIDNIEYALQVYGQIDPNDVVTQNLQRAKMGDIYVKKFGNIYIGAFNPKNIRSISESLNGSVLYLGEGGDELIDSKYSIIRGRDELPAYVISQIK